MITNDDRERAIEAIRRDETVIFRADITGGVRLHGPATVIGCRITNPGYDPSFGWLARPSRDVSAERPAREAAEGGRTRDPEAENAVAEVVMGYGHDGWLPLDLRYGIADEVLDRLHALGYQRASSSALRTVGVRALSEAAGQQIIVGGAGA